MCGIAGLHLRDPGLEPQLGALLGSMLGRAAGRGPDAAGVGLYGDPELPPAGRSTVCVIALPVPVAEAVMRLDAAGVGPVGARPAGATTVFTAPVAAGA